MTSIKRALFTSVAVLAMLLVGAASASAALRHYKLRFGPLKLAGYQVRLNSDRVETPKVDGYIVRMRAHVVDKRGRDIPIRRLMLHHVLFTNLGAFDGQKHDGACPGVPRERFYGTGEEHQTMHFPAGYGVPISKRDRWQAAWMLMNHRRRSDIGYIEYDVAVETARKLTPVKAYWLDATDCAGHVYYDVPGGGAPGSIDSKTVTWRPPFDGRLVAGGAHLHGGADGMRLYQQRCQNRLLFDSKPLYGLPDNAVYHVTPVLHEPGPINTSWFTTKTGIPVTKGEPISVSGDYDAERPHVKVMAVMHVYMARDPRASRTCDPLPADLRNENINVPGRRQAPVIEIPLTGYGPNGRAVTIDGPPGPATVLNGDAKVRVHNFAFSIPNLSIPQGASITWRFPDSISHDVTMASGPFGFSSPFSRIGRTYTQQFERPGTYKLFCTLHPVVMHEVVNVRDPASGSGSPPAKAARRTGAGGPSAGQPVIHW